MKPIRFCCRILVLLIFAAVGSQTLHAQDPTKVDPGHYQTVFENDSVRVLRVTYGPHEKSVMHDHPDGVVVYLTEFSGRFTFPDGTIVDRSGKTGQSRWASGGKHLPENLSDKPYELILVEIKPQKTK